jgi:hypothetical protein
MRKMPCLLERDFTNKRQLPDRRVETIRAYLEKTPW